MLNDFLQSFNTMLLLNEVTCKDYHHIKLNGLSKAFVAFGPL